MSGFGCYKSEESKDILVVYDNFMEFLIFSRGFVRIFIKVLCSRLCLFYYGQYRKSLLYRRNCSKLKAKMSISSIVIVGWVTVELLIENQWCCNMELVLIANSANRVSAIRNVERDEIRLKKRWRLSFKFLYVRKNREKSDQCEVEVVEVKGSILEDKVIVKLQVQA